MVFLWTLLKRTVRDFLADGCFVKAAALAYYAIFSLPPILLLAITVAGSILGEKAAKGELFHQLREHIGPRVADMVETMVNNVNDPRAMTTAAALVGVVGFFVAMTAAFSQLQYALNEIWGLGYTRNVVKNWFMKRLTSLVLVIVVGLLLLASMISSTVISAFSHEVRERWLIAGIDRIVEGTNTVLSVVLLTMFIALIFKVVPDRAIQWRQVWIGAFVTAVLFVVGKYVVAFYLGHSNQTGAYGTASALALILLWVYYSAMILFFGAELTHNWALLRCPPEPETQAMQDDEQILIRL